MEDVRGCLRFADHFSGYAAEYAKFRPDYPDALFEYLALLAPARRRAWDCATGSGQAALALARHFDEVVGSDASARQIESATLHSRVRYRVAFAEASGLEDASVDLVAVAQSLHWFDRERFWNEARRVLVPDGILAVWCYDLLRVAPEVDEVVDHLYREVVGPYWPPERALFEQGYRTLDFPFEEASPPAFVMEKRWSLPEVLGYIGTWSATHRYAEAEGKDPLDRIREDLTAAWGPPDRIRSVRWDLDLRVGRNR